MQSYAPLRRLVSGTALFVALAIGTVVPAGFVVQQVQTEYKALRFKARSNAGKVARYIYMHPTLWQYQGDRILDVVTLPPEDTVRQVITDRNNIEVLDDGVPPAFPALRVQVPIIVDNVEIGSLTVATSLRPLALQAGLVLILSWALACAAFATVRWLPFRVLDRTIGELARQRARFEAALEHMTQALCMFDENHRVAVVNGPFAAMFGAPDTASLMGLSVTGLVERLAKDVGMDRYTCARVLLLDATEVRDAALSAVVALADGRRIVISRTRMRAGSWVATFEDITDRWRAEEAEADRTRALAESRVLRERARAAQETSRAKSLFLATMSHEIRTPLNAVLGLTASLLDGPLNEEQRRVLTTIHDSGDSLLRILNDILDYSKLEAGRLELEDLAFSPAVVSETLQAVMGPRAAAKGLSFEIRTSGALPVALRGDPGRIRQILLNLVSNAVKFTDRGSVTVDAICAAVGAGRAVMEWRVTDTGIGIAADTMDSLFGEFVQADGSINRRFGGSGLGLAICRRLAEQMGGTIAVESRFGHGSMFTFRLDLPVAAVAETAVPPDISATASMETHIVHLGRRLRILLAEDNQTNQFVIRQMLKGFDIQVDTANDGMEAVNAIDRLDYDVVCMDVQMPEMDGLTATRVIRARGGRHALVPIIALTGNAFQEDVKACLEAGMSAFIAKPVGKNLLLQTIVTEMSRQGASVRGRRNGSPRPSDTTVARAESGDGPLRTDLTSVALPALSDHRG